MGKRGKGEKEKAVSHHPFSFYPFFFYSCSSFGIISRKKIPATSRNGKAKRVAAGMGKVLGDLRGGSGRRGARQMYVPVDARNFNWRTARSYVRAVLRVH